MWENFFNWLDDVRHGRFGVALFYSYLVAILIAGGVAIFSLNAVHNEVQRGEKRDARSCAAIQGAVDFWKLVRQSTEDILEDPTLTPTVRASNQGYLEALNDVIKRGSELPCPKP